MRLRSITPLCAGILAAALIATTLLRHDAGLAQATPQPDDRSALALPNVQGPLTGLTQSGGVRKSSKLASDLDDLQRFDAASSAFGRPLTQSSRDGLPPGLSAAVESHHFLLDDAGRVQVLVTTAGDPALATAGLEQLGMSVERTNADLKMIQGQLPIRSLRNAADLDGVLQVRAPERAVRSSGSVSSQGDSILAANALRSTYGADGSGVRVGVISDGMEGLAASQASKDLPVVNITTCDVGTGLPTDAGAGAEGTAMLEIVHDLAPGAELWNGFFNFNTGTLLDFMAAVNCLAANVDVVIDDVGWFGVGPYDGTSSVSMNATNALNNPSNRIRGYYTAAGNSAQRHYRESYVSSGFVINGNPGDSWTAHRFGATAKTTDAGFGLTCPGPITNCGDEITLAAGGKMSVIVQWNDPFGNSTNDYDLLLLDETGAGTLSLQSGGIQNGAGSDPVEGFSFTNTHGVTTAFDVLIGNFHGVAAARAFDMFINCSGCLTYPGGANHNFNTTAGSVSNNSDAGGGVISSGAIAAADPAHTNIETFSSRGPTVDNRVKPDIAAIDGVSVTGNGGFPSTFFGTSATSPHMGAIAALILTCRPSLKRGEIGDNPANDRTALRNALLTTATDLGLAGNDSTFGAGRANATAAAAAAGCTADADGDGCPDARENGVTHQQGGVRDPLSQWDFFDVPSPALTASATIGRRSRTVTLSDTIAILTYIGATDNGPPNANGVDYDTDLDDNGVKDGAEYDRSPSVDGTKPWQTGAPNGSVTIADAISSLSAIGDTCAT